MFEAIKSLLGLRPRAPKQLSDDERAKLLLCLEDYLKEGLAKAFPASSVRADVLDALSGELPDDELAAAIDARLPVLEDARRAEMASWPEVTDCDRLDATFADLKSNGLIAEQNYWCCQTCASSDAHATIKRARKGGGVRCRGAMCSTMSRTPIARFRAEAFFLPMVQAKAGIRPVMRLPPRSSRRSRSTDSNPNGTAS